MEKLILDFVKQVNLPQVTLIGLIVFYFYARLDDKIKESHKDLKEDIKSINIRIDKIEDKFQAVNARFDALSDKVEHCF